MNTFRILQNSATIVANSGAVLGPGKVPTLTCVFRVHLMGHSNV